MAKLRKAKENGTSLTNEDKAELEEMYLSGLYYASEMCEWFGISYYEYNCYLTEMGLRKERT